MCAWLLGAGALSVRKLNGNDFATRTNRLLWFRHNIYDHIFAVIRVKRRMPNEINVDVELQRPEILLYTVVFVTNSAEQRNDVNSTEQWHCNMECKNYCFKDENSSDKRFISFTIRPAVTWISFWCNRECELWRKMIFFFFLLSVAACIFGINELHMNEWNQMCPCAPQRKYCNN